MIGTPHIERFLPIVRSLTDHFKLTDDIADRFTLDREGAIRVVWFPFEYVPKRPGDRQDHAGAPSKENPYETRSTKDSA
jgi:hypothetical protein